MEKTVFFIRGYMRSGTNWLNRILNLHPDINGIGEFHLQELNSRFNEIYNNFYVPQVEMYRERGAEIFVNEYHKFIKNVIAAYCGDYPIVGDRTPTVLNDFILPDCKYIIISRDGRDVIVSWFHLALKTNSPVIAQYPEMIAKREKFLENPQYFKQNPKELLDCEACFKEVAQNWNNYIVGTKNICDTTNFSYYWIKYEDLHSETEKYRQELYSFLGANPYFAAPLNSETIPGVLRESPMGHNRKGIVGDWEQHFTDDNRKWFLEVASKAANILELPLI